MTEEQKHCDPECDVGLTDGRNIPINATDNHCQGHNAYWRVFGDNVPYCDAKLITCLEGETTPSHPSFIIFLQPNLRNRIL